MVRCEKIKNFHQLETNKENEILRWTTVEIGRGSNWKRFEWDLHKSAVVGVRCEFASPQIMIWNQPYITDKEWLCMSPLGLVFI